MNILDIYRKAIAKQGLLAGAEPPEQPNPPLSKKERDEAIRQAYFTNLEQWIAEEPDIRVELKRLLKKKRGISRKWGPFETAALISDVRSRITKRSTESLTKKSSTTAICKELSGLAHWSSFLGAVDNGGETLRQRYTVGRRDPSLKLLVNYFSKQSEQERANFVRQVIDRPDQQGTGQELDQFINRMVRPKG